MPVVFMRQATVADCESIKGIIEDARRYLKEQGLAQWQNHYPNDGTIEQDIASGIGYVLVADHQVAGYAAITEGEDELYTAIRDGQWQNDNTHYAAIHRFAITNAFRGQKLAHRLFTAILTKYRALGYCDFRIDTHPDNTLMQHVMTSNGFGLCGHVDVIEDGQPAPRVAYQLIID